ncbi:MAG: hypothetical protein OEZ08_08070 [Betaproteobacteria bacterium]|nr:hypothetical protein [Betaproteobacteria bacterium]
MQKQLLKYIKLNGLQYNPQRDPQAYRRSLNQPFRIQALLEGSGRARCTLADERGKPLAEKTVALPGTFVHEIAFASAGSRVVTLTCEGAGQKIERDLRLDVLEHDWVG